MSIKIQNKNTAEKPSYNADTLKLLLFQKAVRDAVKTLRIKVGIPKDGYDSEKDFLLWLKKIRNSYFKQGNLTKLDRKQIAKYKQYYTSINAILSAHNLTKDYFPPIHNYIGYNEMPLRITGNYELHLHWPDTTNQPLYAEIEIFRRLSTAELKEITASLKSFAECYLPEHRKVATRPKKNLDRDIKIATQMKERRTHTEKKYDSSYLDAMKKSVDRGTMSKSDLLEAEANLKYAVEIKKTRLTSKDVAKKFFGSGKRSSTVRKANSRLMAEAKKRFKKV